MRIISNESRPKEPSSSWHTETFGRVQSQYRGGSTFCFHLVSRCLYSLPQPCSSSSNQPRLLSFYPLFFLCFTFLPRCVGEGPVMSSSEGLREWYEGCGGGRPTQVWYQCTNGSTTVWYEKWPTAEMLNKLRPGFPVTMQAGNRHHAQSLRSAYHLMCHIFFILRKSTDLIYFVEHCYTPIETDVHCTITVWWCKCVKYSVAVLMLFQCNIQYICFEKKKKMVITDTLYFVDAKCFMLSMQIQMLFVNCLQI